MTFDQEAAEEILAELVAARTPNPPGDERAAVPVIEAAAARFGLGEPTRLGPRAERRNLIYRIGEGRPTLLVAAHMDTMPPGDLDAWHSDPFVTTVDGDRIRGLGVADMKGAIVAMLLAGRRLVEDPPTDGTLLLAFTADEEAGSAEGMAWLCDQGAIAADAAVMAEPSSTGENSWETLFVAQRGSCIVELVATGVPGHSGETVEAELRAGPMLALALRAIVESEPFDTLKHPVNGMLPTVNVGTMIRGGEVPFAHPPELRATIETRVITGMTEDGVVARFNEVLANAGLAERAWVEPIEGTSWISPGEIVTDERLLGAASGAWRSVIGGEPELGVMPAGTDSSIVDALGIPSLPAFGPGTLGVAHRPNESVPRSDLGTATDMLERLARNYFDGAS